MGMMYSKLPNLILGFHGCSNDVYRKVIVEGEQLNKSNNSYDWLGNGIYFWEQNYVRAKEWANHRYGDDGAVIGAVLDLGNCLNLTDSSSSEVLKRGYELLVYRCETTGNDLPVNRPSKKTKDVLLRDLDCAVIQQIHDYNSENNEPMFDSVRGIFTEGGPVFPGAEFQLKTHVQICICNPNCIKGYFTPLTINNEYPLP